MSCEYCQVGDYTDFCICKKEGDICPFMRRCDVNRVWLPLDSMSKCSRRIVPKKRKEGIALKQGEYIVEYVQGGKLYINVDGALIRMPNPYKYEPDKVKLIKVDGKMYIEEFAPKQDKPSEGNKQEEPKKVPNKKSKSKKGE